MIEKLKADWDEILDLVNSKNRVRFTLGQWLAVSAGMFAIAPRVSVGSARRCT